ncbi:MAG: hypothetical protein WAN14_10170 [Candidatus Acidiferrales bacterium]
MRRFRIRITSGRYKGRYVGPNFSDGLVTSPEHIASRDVSIPGTLYSLYEQMRSASEYLLGTADQVQRRLKNFGYDSEREAVDVLDSLVGLSLSVQNVEERILKACKLKLTEANTDRVQLVFGENANDLVIEKGTTVEVLKQALALIRAKGYDRISTWRPSGGKP